jgi:hypothetical protein
MGKNVFANGREVSAKADDNKSIAAMPDVCLSPPSPPAGPIPIPYPNFSNSSKTTSGSKKVKIGNKEVGLKNKSVYKSSKGDEAATRSFGMGVVTHTLSGATKHAAWSFDVKVEGKNVIRFLDLTTHNHSSDPMNAGAMTIDVAKAMAAAGEPLNCEALDLLNKDARDNQKNEGVDNFTLTTSSFTSPEGKNESWGATAPRREVVITPESQSGYRDVNRKKTMACGDGEWGQDDPRHSSVNNNMARNHAEPKLIEPHFGGGPNVSPGPAPSGPPGSLGTLRMKTHHQTGPGQFDAMPCPTCKRGICEAVACGLEILLCNDKNEEVNAEEMCENGQPKPGKVSDDWDEQVAAEDAFWKGQGLG